METENQKKKKDQKRGERPWQTIFWKKPIQEGAQGRGVSRTTKGKTPKIEHVKGG